MKHFAMSASQRGTALAFSLLILLVLTIVGVASMSNTQMQERMAGNFNLQSVAFEAASAGISQALETGIDELFDENPRCDKADLSNPSIVLPSTTYDDFPPQVVSSIEDQNLIVQYRLKTDCLDDESFDSDNPNRPTQAYVTSKGEVRFREPSGEPGALLAEREIEVRLDSLRTDARSAIRLEGEAEVSCCGNQQSQQFRVSGEGGPAISTTTQSNASRITTEIGESRLNNYEGGIASSTYDSPFNSSWQLARFALEIRAFIEFHRDKLGGSRWPSVCDQIGADDWTSTTDPGGFKDVFGNYVPEMNLAEDFTPGNSTVNGIYYVTDTLTMSGQTTGSGLIIAQGDVIWKGTPDYKGVIIGLGGSFTVSGAGRGETEGTVFISNVDIAGGLEAEYDDLRSDWLDNLEETSNTTNWDFVLDLIHQEPSEGGWGNLSTGTVYEYLYDSTPDGFGTSALAIDGGGTALVKYDCDRFEDVNRMLAACGQTTVSPPLDFEYNGLADPWESITDYCNTPGLGATLQTLESWRENLGWRELLSGN